MAYAVKPAVVRVNAYATARVRYSPEALLEVEAKLRSEGYKVTARKFKGVTGLIETGTGGSGSGFVINPDGFIVTSGHVVAPTRDPIRMRADLLRNGAIAALVKHFPIDVMRALYREDRLEPLVRVLLRDAATIGVSTIEEVELSNGEKAPFKVARFSPSLRSGGVDLALLRVGRRDLPAVRLGNSETVHLGDSVWAIGYPSVASSSDEVIGGWLSQESDLEATLNPGTITALKRNLSNTPVFQSNVAIYRGNSGGPVVNAAGEVVGVSTWGHTDAEGIKFLVPVNVAKSFIAPSKVEINKEGKFDLPYRRSLNRAGEGDWLFAREDLREANRVFPSSPDVSRFSAEVERSIQALPFWRSQPLLARSGAAVGLLSATFLVAFLTTVAIRQQKIRSEARQPYSMVVAPGSRGEGASEKSEGRMGVGGLLGKFTILNGDRAGQKLGLGGSGIRIGRETSVCEIVLENPKVSRIHAEVVAIDGQVLLIDRNSSNGTFVNDRKIERHYLKDGDIIYFGGRNAVAVAFHA